MLTLAANEDEDNRSGFRKPQNASTPTGDKPMQSSPSQPSRRSVLRHFGALPAAGIAAALPRFAHAADFSLKYGHNLPVTHPLNIRAQEAADRIARESKGRVEIKIFPNNQLGGD